MHTREAIRMQRLEREALRGHELEREALRTQKSESEAMRMHRLYEEANSQSAFRKAFIQQGQWWEHEAARRATLEALTVRQDSALSAATQALTIAPETNAIATALESFRRLEDAEQKMRAAAVALDQRDSVAAYVTSTVQRALEAQYSVAGATQLTEEQNYVADHARKIAAMSAALPFDSSIASQLDQLFAPRQPALGEYFRDLYANASRPPAPARPGRKRSRRERPASARETPPQAENLANLASAVGRELAALDPSQLLQTGPRIDETAVANAVVNVWQRITHTFPNLSDATRQTLIQFLLTVCLTLAVYQLQARDAARDRDEVIRTLQARATGDQNVATELEHLRKELRPKRYQPLRAVILREGPSEKAQRTAQLGRSDVLELRDERGRWLYVAITRGPHKGLEGWVYYRSLRPLAPDAE
jgi:hypothetical protein